MKHEMRRKDRLVSEEKAREIMEKAEYGIFMTADAEGQPYGVAVSHVVDGDKVYFHCAADVGRKIENIKANNKVCMNFTTNTYVDGENYTLLGEKEDTDKAFYSQNFMAPEGTEAFPA